MQATQQRALSTAIPTYLGTRMRVTVYVTVSLMVCDLWLTDSLSSKLLLME